MGHNHGASLLGRLSRISRFDLFFYGAAVVYGIWVAKELADPSVMLRFSNSQFGPVELPAALGSAIGFGAGFTGGVFGAFIGILTVTFLTIFGGLPITLAKGTAVFQAVFTALFATGNHFKNGTADLKVGGTMAVGGLVGGWIGASLSVYLEPEAMRAVFSGVLVVAAAYMALQAYGASSRGRPGDTDRAMGFVPELLKIDGHFDGRDYRVDAVSALSLGLVIGTVAGLLGVGGGFLLTPSINIALGIPIHVAVGTSSSVIVANTASATGGYLGQGAVFMELGVAVLLGGFFGARVGQQVNHRLPDRGLKVAFALLLLWSAWRMAP